MRGNEIECLLYVMDFSKAKTEVIYIFHSDCTFLWGPEGNQHPESDQI